MITLYIACSRLSNSGKDTKEKDTRKVGGAKKRKRKKPLLSPVSSHFIFVFTLSQFSRPDYLRAWNRLHCTMKGKVDGLWNKIFMGIFRSTLHVFFLFLWPLWLNHTHSKTDDITRSRRELDRHGGGGGGRHGWFRRECRNTLKLYLLPPIFSPFFIKMCWRTLKRDSLQSYFLHLQHQTLAPSFAIVQTGSGLGQKILDIFVLETARVNGTYISESLRPTVTKKNILLVKVEFLRFLTCIEPQEGKVNQTQFS